MRTIRSRMTPLRQRMLEDLQLRNYSEHTIRAYLHCVADFARHFRTSPEHLGPEQVRTYQLFLVQDKQVAHRTRSAHEALVEDAHGQPGGELPVGGGSASGRWTSSPLTRARKT